MSILQADDQFEDDCAAQTASATPLIQIASSPDSPAAGERRVRVIMAGGLIVVGIMCVVVRFLYPFDFLGDQSYGWLMDRVIARLLNFIGKWSPVMMLSYPLALLGIFILERKFPANPTQTPLSTGLVTDGVWVIIYSMYSLCFFGAYSNLIFHFYKAHLSFLDMPVPESVPVWVRMAIAVLVIDLAQWCQHWLHHNVKWLWPFHAIHHSQREVNVFSDYRGHFMEYVAKRPLTLLPLLMLGVEDPAITWWLLITSWHSKLQHSNIRTNYGWLRYILVTPQSHRVHHSIREEHHNSNYGSMLSIWDRLFGTQVRQYDIYPKTGIDDKEFPLESARSVGNVLISPLRQLVYPFRQVWTLLRGARQKRPLVQEN